VPLNSLKADQAQYRESEWYLDNTFHFVNPIPFLTTGNKIHMTQHQKNLKQRCLGKLNDTEALRWMET
jgi:hypothetical protein